MVYLLKTLPVLIKRTLRGAPFPEQFATFLGCPDNRHLTTIRCQKIAHFDVMAPPGPAPIKPDARLSDRCQQFWVCMEQPGDPLITRRTRDDVRPTQVTRPALVEPC